MAMTVVSAQVFTKRDEAGTPRTEGWFLLEFRAAGYMPGGEDVDLRNYFRAIEHVLVNKASGQIRFLPEASLTDFPVVGAGVQSGRFQLHWVLSGQGTTGEIASGIAVSGARAKAYVVGY